MSYPTEWRLEAWTVYGGWQIARARWVRDRIGQSDQEFEWVGDRTVYSTEAECAEAIRNFKVT